MTTAQVYQPLTAQHQPHARHAGRWTQPRHALKPQPTPYGRAGQAAKPVQRLEIAAHSLHCCKVAANISNRHPATDWRNVRGFAVNVLDANNLNFASIGASADSGVCQTLTGCECGGFDLNKCLHVVSPVDEHNNSASCANYKHYLKKIVNKSFLSNKTTSSPTNTGASSS